MQQMELLPCLAAVLKEARLDAGLTYAHVAVHVHKRSGKAGVSESTLLRFERGQAWPEDPDAVVSAYAEALSTDPRRMWSKAVARMSRGRVVGLNNEHDDEAHTDESS